MQHKTAFRLDWKDFNFKEWYWVCMFLIIPVTTTGLCITNDWKHIGVWFLISIGVFVMCFLYTLVFWFIFAQLGTWIFLRSLKARIDRSKQRLQKYSSWQSWCGKAYRPDKYGVTVATERIEANFAVHRKRAAWVDGKIYYLEARYTYFFNLW